jgi:hypothetical protein
MSSGLTATAVSKPFIDPGANFLYGPDAQVRLGFGCAQLMRLSRKGERQRLLDSAFAAGIRHFDVARMYGLGTAEAEVGRFVGGRRDQTSIATKFGIEPPCAALARLQAPARFAIARVPALRRVVKRRDSAFRSAGDYRPAAARASLEKSLTELGTEYVDLFFVHDPGAVAPAEMAALTAELDALRDEGKLRAWGVSGEPDAVRALAAGRPDVQPQWREDAFEPRGDAGEGPPPISFGVLSAAMPRIAARLTDPAERRRWSEAVGVDCGDPEVLAGLLLVEALDRNRHGGVLFATVRPERLPSAVAAARDADAGFDREETAALRRLIGECAKEAPVA